jgi:methionyl-tRNA formyltransferase
MRIVFLGSGAFALPALKALAASGHEIAMVVTQPDRQKGRGLDLTAPPVKSLALRLGLPVLQPERVKEPAAVEEIASLRPALLVVVAYGQILPRSVIDIAPLGTVNVHASLLPRYRGAAPIQWAIARGEEVTGVTTMLIDEGLDTGPLLLSASTPIAPEETAGELEGRLAQLGADVLMETIDGLEGSSLTPHPQDHDLATLAPRIHKQDGRIDWHQPADTISRRVRAFNPWPGARARLDERTLKILRARPGERVTAAPGSIINAGKDAFAVACGDGASVEILEVQPENRRPMAAAAFLRGLRATATQRFT